MGNSHKIPDSLEDYHDYLPEKKPEEKARYIPRRQLRKCPRYKRMLINFNYPNSCKPKQVLILPYLSDNSI